MAASVPLRGALDAVAAWPPDAAVDASGRRPVAVIDPIDPVAERRLAYHCEVVHPDDADPASLRAAIAEAHGIIVRTTPLPRAVLEAGQALRVIAKHGTGVDNIDTTYATQRRIVVARTSGANAAAVAEFALTAILVACKPMLAAAEWLRRGSSSAPLVVAAERAGFIGCELSEIAVGVVGWGAIGRRVGTSIVLLGGSVVVYDPVACGSPDAPGVRFAQDLPTLLREVDVVTVHVPLTAETRSLIGAPELAMMRPGGALVNTSRGGVVDEAALAEAIVSGQLRTAAVDVFECEPPDLESRLLQLREVLCTPHIAGSTRATLRRMGDATVDAVLDVLGDTEPSDVANPDVLAVAGLLRRETGARPTSEAARSARAAAD